MRPPRQRSSLRNDLPRSESLHQMKSLRSRMQKIEERVHSARSKLPPPYNSPRSSPRGGPGAIPSSITVRRSSKRIPSAIAHDLAASSSEPRESHIKRLSYGLPRPASTTQPLDRSPSALDRPQLSRPSSRISAPPTRPDSRSATSRSDIPTPGSRPPSSVGGASYSTLHSSQGPGSPRKSLHRARQSVSVSEKAEEGVAAGSRQRRTSGLPAPMGHARRQSVQLPGRPGTAMGGGRPPSRRKEEEGEGVGETY